MYFLEVSVQSDELLNPRDAARSLGISYPTLKQWIYKKKLRSIRTAGGHHRIPASEIERFLPRTEEKDTLAGRRNFRRNSKARKEITNQRDPDHNRHSRNRRQVDALRQPPVALVVVLAPVGLRYQRVQPE